MPRANSTARPRIARLWNSPPMNTISTDIPTSNRNVLALLACGCQVIGASSLLETGTVFADLTLGRPPRVPYCSAVAVHGVVHQRGQRLAAWPFRQVGELVAGLRGVPRHGLLGLGHTRRPAQQPQRLGQVVVVL